MNHFPVDRHPFGADSITIRVDHRLSFENLIDVLCASYHHDLTTAAEQDRVLPTPDPAHLVEAVRKQLTESGEGWWGWARNISFMDADLITHCRTVARQWALTIWGGPESEPVA